MRDIEKQGIKVAVDAVVFSVMQHDLKILLIKRKNPPFQGLWALPGGFVRNDEELEEAAARELYEETNVKNIFLKKLTAYGAVNRDPRGRIISIVYLALIDAEKVRLESKTDAERAQWFSLDELPKLAFDHQKIIAESLEELRYEIQTTNIAFQLLPQKFTLTELQKAYEAVLGKALDKRNFRKMIQELHLLKDEKETKMEGAHRPAQLFSFKEKRYSFLK